jgi:hypothetical protein
VDRDLSRYKPISAHRLPHLTAPGDDGYAGIDGPEASRGRVPGDPLWILSLLGRADPAGVVTGHHTCLS